MLHVCEHVRAPNSASCLHIHGRPVEPADSVDLAVLDGSGNIPGPVMHAGEMSMSHAVLDIGYCALIATLCTG